MPDDKGLEEEVKAHFKSKAIMRAENIGQQMIYSLMMKNKFGALVGGPTIGVDWKRVFAENQCPQCKDMMSLKEDKYVCAKCGLTIPLSLYDASAAEYKRETMLREDDLRVTQKVKDAGWDDKRVEIIFRQAQDEVQTELESRRRQALAREQAKTVENGIGKTPKP
jgi:ribosomal protein S27AE